jgi:hypothetical protein
MISILSILALLVALLPWSSLARSGEGITEEYVVNSLSSESRGFNAENPPGFAFTVALSPHNRAATTGGKRATNGESPLDEESYKKLIPIGRALESDPLEGFRYVIVVQASGRGAEDRDGRLSLQVAEAIQQFLTTYFAIALERLSIERMETPSLPGDSVAESRGPPLGHVEIRAFTR